MAPSYLLDDGGNLAINRSEIAFDSIWVNLRDVDSIIVAFKPYFGRLFSPRFALLFVVHP